MGIQTLYLGTFFPEVFWNCACLIVNSGGIQETAEEDEEESNEEESDEKQKKKNKTTDYGKVATAIGNMKQVGININLPDINKSDVSFTPNLDTNSIYYGLKGITGIGDDFVEAIICGRPFKSWEDFNSRVKTNKIQMINLIKSGCFDNLGDRYKIMDKYLQEVSNLKKKVNLQNMSMLITYNLIPEEMSFYSKLYSYNKFLKSQKERDNYNFNEKSLEFFLNNFDGDLLESNEFILQKTWDNLYKKKMKIFSDYLKDNQQNILEALNNALITEQKQKYSAGSISKWEMDSINFYYNEHELQGIKNKEVKIIGFNELPESPIPDRTFNTKEGQEITLYELNCIVGTVLDKDTTRNTVSLLTPNGVASVKIWKNQFVKYNKQISQKLPDGKKQIIEKSWFTRGNLLMFYGMRRGDNFIPKVYKNSPFKVPIMKITEVRPDGTFDFIDYRAEVDDE